MRLLPALLLGLILPAAALPQAKPKLESRGEFDLGERVVAHKFLDGENRLVLVGPKSVRVLGAADAKLSEPRALEVPQYDEDRPRLISPDGRRVLVFGNYDARLKKDAVRHAPAVWDLQTGRRIASLDKTARPIRAALWSKNGRTLATSSDRYAPSFTDSSSVEVAFWDGETFERRSTLPTDRVAWWRLTDDGESCVYSAGEIRGRIPIIDTKYVAPAGPLSVWSVGGARVEQTVTAGAGGVERKIRDRRFSPDGKFLALLVQPPKSKDAERWLAVWEVGDGGELKLLYELRPSPRVGDWFGSFSPSAKYFWLDAGPNLQIYETRTGEKRFELPNFDEPYAWLSDEVFYTTRYGKRMEAYEAATGKHLYRKPLVYDAYTYTPSDANDTMPSIPVTEVRDETKIVAHPRGRVFLTYSKQFVRVSDTRTGEVLQTLVEPPMDYTKKKPQLSTKPLVSKADWSGDGRTLYVISANERSVSLWRLVED